VIQAIVPASAGAADTIIRVSIAYRGVSHRPTSVLINTGLQAGASPRDVTSRLNGFLSELVV